ncbi:hypothetical protein YC2023_022459 [Brassica napus]
MGNLSQSKGECIGKIMLKMTSNRNKNMILGTLMSNYKFEGVTGKALLTTAYHKIYPIQTTTQANRQYIPYEI